MQLKKLLAIFLAAALMFSVFAVTGSAETVETFKVGVVAETTTPISSNPQIINQGEDVSVRVTVNENTGISFLRFTINFDANALEYVDYENHNLISPNEKITVKEGYLIFFVDLTNITSDVTGDLLTINFKTKSDFCGDTKIYTELVQNRTANCSRYDTYSSNVHVPFVSEEAQFSIHNIEEEGVVTDPTCLDKGYTTYHCSDCDKDVVGNIVDALGHTEADVVVENKVDATCTENGSYDDVVYCSVCDAELSRENKVIEATGHTEANAVIENTVNASCTVNGSYDVVVYCEICNEELNRTAEVIEALGHTEGEVQVENKVDPDCENTGSYDNVVYCTVCEEELSRETITVDALGHTPGAEATCTEAQKCTVCDKVLVEALGHDEVSHEAQAPSCTEIGWDAYVTCSRCDYTTYVEKEALGHTYGESTVVEPEYKKEGYTTHTCTVCEYVEKYDIVPALTYILGDTNGDESIDSDDAINLLYYTLDSENNTVNQKCDFNGDGVVDSDDAIYLLYHTLSSEEFPLSK